MTIAETKTLVKKLLKDKTRLSGESYYENSLKIASKIKSYGIKDEATLKLALIHHIPHAGTKRANLTLRKSLSPEMNELLERYNKFTETKIKTESLENFNERYLIQACINLVGDIRVLIVRIVSKLDDLENSWMFPKQKREDIALRAMYLYSPLAKIIGINALSKDLQDNAFKILFPMEYFTLKKLIRKKKYGVKTMFKEVEKVLKELLIEQGLSDFEIHYRIKGLYSTYKKMLRKAPEIKDPNQVLSEIHDLFALRIIVKTTEECYLVENILQQLWENIPGERDDYIEKPRSSGYQAIHNNFLIREDMIIEAQIKTYEMHQKAEFGVSSHLLYKIGDKGEKSEAVEEYKKYLKKHPEWFRELNIWELQKTRGYIPSTPFSDKEYVLTPKGDIVELPRGATVVDFAYAVHTGIGDKCVGGFVNNRIVKLDHVVKTGDIVKIKTDGRKKGPSRDWLDFVATRRARMRINQGLRRNLEKATGGSEKQKTTKRR